jgi:hydroxymethylglutaryl-CoA synthase
MSGTRENFYPQDVGILGIEIYYPSQYVSQEKLEEFDKVSKGKYTIGLGQNKMGFCVDNEDINSICLTVLNNLLDNYNLKHEQIGRIDVGTETLIDKSKSVKSTLMSLFLNKNTDIEGVDNVNACFGGTAALFNAINWIESSYWDGRFAIVIMGDIAIYSKGSARPTGGAGAVALLIGPNASLKFERGLRSLHISHAYDFYKPKLDSEYPLVDGKLSISCYLSALDKCYQLFKKKYLNQLNNNTIKSDGSLVGDVSSGEFSLEHASAFIFHSPYCKLVQKSFARLIWNDYLSESSWINGEIKDKLDKFKHLTEEETFTNKQLEQELVSLSKELFESKTKSSLLFANLIGNMYTPSLYSCLVSYLINTPIESLDKSRIVLFSYGSGFASAMFSLTVNLSVTQNSQFKFYNLIDNLKQKRDQLETRVEIDPLHYDRYLQVRESNHKQAPFIPKFSQETLFPGTWYLTSIDEQYRRNYERKPKIDRFDTNLAKKTLIECIESLY